LKQLASIFFANPEASPIAIPTILQAAEMAKYYSRGALFLAFFTVAAVVASLSTQFQAAEGAPAKDGEESELVRVKRMDKDKKPKPRTPLALVWPTTTTAVASASAAAAAATG
jgi:hypothetical protein